MLLDRLFVLWVARTLSHWAPLVEFWLLGEFLHVESITLVKYSHSCRTYVNNEKPKYPTGHSINLGGQIGVLVLSIAGIAYCKWENRQRVLGKRDHRLNGLDAARRRDLGYRHPDFRYITWDLSLFTSHKAFFFFAVSFGERNALQVALTNNGDNIKDHPICIRMYQEVWNYIIT